MSRLVWSFAPWWLNSWMVQSRHGHGGSVPAMDLGEPTWLARNTDVIRRKVDDD